MVAAASASSLVLPAAVAAAAYSSLSVPFLSFPPGVPLLSQHRSSVPGSSGFFSFLLGGIQDSDPDPEVVSSAAAEAVNYRAEETAVVPRAG